MTLIEILEIRKHYLIEKRTMIISSWFGMFKKWKLDEIDRHIGTIDQVIYKIGQEKK